MNSMILIIREYLSMLKERDELDALIPDLLLSMGIQPKTRPKRGTRQYGVDCLTVGKDKKDGKEKVFIFVIKRGDITRKNWNGSSPQDVKPSLDDIFDVYLSLNIEESLKKLPKKIILCFNGELDESVLPSWKGYTSRMSKEGQIEFEYWGANKISLLIQKHLLEFLFTENIQKNMRKTLSFLDLVDYDMRHFYSVIDEILFQNDLPKLQDKIKSLRVLNLCLNMVFQWCQEVNNLKHSYLAGERLLLKVWSWLNKNSLFENEDIIIEFYKIDKTRNKINYAYYEKVKHHCYVRDGLAGYGGGAEKIEYPLLVIEQIGILSLIGLEFAFPTGIEGIDEKNKNNINHIAYTLSCLIKNNKSSNNPLFDGHINDISLGLLLLYYAGKEKVMKNWILELFNYIFYRYNLEQKFPLLSDSYDELIDVEVNNEEVELSASTLLPILIEWCVLLDMETLYEDVVEAINKNFTDLDLQIWYPDENIESYLYKDNALYKTGSMRHTIILPEKLEDHKAEILSECKREENPERHSFIEYSMPVVALIANRHFKTPIFPFYWRKFM